LSYYNEALIDYELDIYEELGKDEDNSFRKKALNSFGKFE
jgi:hypothetical protein